MALDYKAIGKRVQNARARAKMTQEQLAEKVSLSISHISNIETGSTRVSLAAIVNLANALSVTADDLLCDNLIHARPQFERDIRQIIDGCSPYELRVIRGSLKELYSNLRENEKYFCASGGKSED